MSEFSTPLRSGMSVSDGTNVVRVPQSVEAVEGTAAERKAVLEGFVADMKVKDPEVALVRASARMAKQDPQAAETAFTAQQATAVADATTVSPGGKV